MIQRATYKGFESWFNEVRMKGKMFLTMTLILISIEIGFFVSMNTIKAWDEWGFFLGCEARNFKKNFFKKDSFDECQEVRNWIFDLQSELFLWSVFLIFFPGYALLFLKFRGRARDQAENKFLRGAKFISPKELIKKMKKAGENLDLPIGDLTLPVTAEVKHLFLPGRPGVGKTVLISQLLHRIKERGDRSIVYDFKGDYLGKFFNPETDIIFNPLDSRCKGWSIFREVQNKMDIDSIAHSLISPSFQQDPFWNDAARDVLTGILHYLFQAGAWQNSDIWKAVTSPITDIAAWLKSTPGGERGHVYIQDASSKQAMSVHAVLMQYCKAFEFLSDPADSDQGFSISPWLESGKGCIFITNYSSVKDTLKPILSLFVDLLGKKLLSLKDDYHRRIFFLLDEFGTLQRLSTIKDLLTLSRSKGGCVFIGVQDVGQIDKIYGEHLRQSIINACGSCCSFAVSDPVTAKFLSDKIGEIEELQTEEGLQMGVGVYRDGLSLTTRKKLDRLILPSEIMNLPDLTAFLKIPNYDITRIQLTYRSYPSLHEPFIIKPDLILKNVENKAAPVRPREEKEIASPTRTHDLQKNEVTPEIELEK